MFNLPLLPPKGKRGPGSTSTHTRPSDLATSVDATRDNTSIERVVTGGEGDSIVTPSLQRSQSYNEAALKQDNDKLSQDLEAERFNSKQVLRDLVEYKKTRLALVETKSKDSIKKQLDNSEMPRMINKDNEFHRDYRPPFKGKKELRERQKLKRKVDRDQEMAKGTNMRKKQIMAASGRDIS